MCIHLLLCQCPIIHALAHGHHSPSVAFHVMVDCKCTVHLPFNQIYVMRFQGEQQCSGVFDVSHCFCQLSIVVCVMFLDPCTEKCLSCLQIWVGLLAEEKDVCYIAMNKIATFSCSLVNLLLTSNRCFVGGVVANPFMSSGSSCNIKWIYSNILICTFPGLLKSSVILR